MRIPQLLLLILVFGSVAVYTQTATVIVTKANVRAEPDATARILSTVKRGAGVTLLSTDNLSGWYRVQAGRMRGWLHGSTIKLGDFTGFTATRNTELPDLTDYVVKDEWIFFATSNKGENRFYINPAKVKRSGNLREFWVQIKDSDLKLTSMSLFRVDCKSSTILILSSTTFKADGSVDDIVGEKPNSIYIRPGSVNEEIEKRVCAEKGYGDSVPATADYSELDRLADESDAIDREMRDMGMLREGKNRRPKPLPAGTYVPPDTGSIQGVYTGGDLPPTITIRNASDRRFTVTVGGAKYSIDAGGSEVVDLESGVYDFEGAAARVIPVTGRKNFENGYRYDWVFSIVTRRGFRLRRK